jgi:HlyD family secretion protein
MRTVYIMASKGDPQNPGDVKLNPVQIKVGISDGVSTEVLEGLDEGAQVVTGVISTGEARSGGPQANPFGGGFRRF